MTPHRRTWLPQTPAIRPAVAVTAMWATVLAATTAALTAILA